MKPLSSGPWNRRASGPKWRNDGRRNPWGAVAGRANDRMALTLVSCCSLPHLELQQPKEVRNVNRFAKANLERIQMAGPLWGFLLAVWRYWPGRADKQCPPKAARGM